MSASNVFTPTGPRLCRAGIARAAALLITAMACALIVGCASRGTLKKTVGNDTREINHLTALADDPQPEIHPAAWATPPVTAKTLRDGPTIEYRDGELSDVLQ